MESQTFSGLASGTDTSTMSVGPPSGAAPSSDSASGIRTTPVFDAAPGLPTSELESQQFITTFQSIFKVSPDKPLYDIPIPEKDLTPILQDYEQLTLQPLLGDKPTPSKKSSNWFNDAMDRAGERVETLLYPVFKILLLAQTRSSLSFRELKTLLQDATLLVGVGLQEARIIRI